MAIDARIPLGVQQQQVESPMNRMAQVMQIKGLQDQQAMRSMQLAEMERERAAANALAEAWKGSVGPDGTTDRNKLFQTLAQGGQGAKIPTIQKQFADTDKSAAELGETKAKTQNTELDMSLKRAQYTASVLSQAKDQASYDMARQSLTRQFGPQVAQMMPPQFDPNFVQTQVAQGMTVVQRLEDMRRQEQNAETGRHNRATEGISVDNNRRTVGASLANAAATREIANATRDAARIKDMRDVEMKLADDYRNQSKPFKEVSDAYKIISASLKNATTSPAATLAGATKFMKLLDPGSVVRESELGMALAASGVLDRAANYVNVLQRGRVLTQQQARDFENIAGQIYQAAQQQQQMIDSNYNRQAEQYKLRPEMIIQDLGQNQKNSRVVDLSSMPSGGGGKVVNFGDLK